MFEILYIYLNRKGACENKCLTSGLKYFYKFYLFGKLTTSWILKVCKEIVQNISILLVTYCCSEEMRIFWTFLYYTSPKKTYSFANVQVLLHRKKEEPKSFQKRGEGGCWHPQLIQGFRTWDKIGLV